MSSESLGGVHWVLGRVATGAIYHELVHIAFKKHVFVLAKAMIGRNF